MNAKPFKVEFFVKGEPRGQPRPRAFARKMGDRYVARIYDDSSAEGWKNLIAIAARPFIPFPALLGPVRLTLLFVFPRPKAHFRTGRNAGVLRDDAPYWHTAKPDRDNCEKAVADCLKTLGFFKDDSQLCSGPIDKIYGDVPGCNVKIESLENDFPATAQRQANGAAEWTPPLPLQGANA